MSKSKFLSTETKLKILEKAKKEGRVLEAIRFYNADNDYFIVAYFKNRKGKLVHFTFDKQHKTALENLGITIRG